MSASELRGERKDVKLGVSPSSYELVSDEYARHDSPWCLARTLASQYALGNSRYPEGR